MAHPQSSPSTLRVVGIVTQFFDPAARPCIALIAHDAKKEELLRLARTHIKAFAFVRFMATGSSGALIAEEIDLDVECMATGPDGGDLQIGASIVAGEVDAVIFLRDPLTAHPGEPSIDAIMKVCDVHGVPLATNRGTAEILLRNVTRRSKVDRSRISHPSVFSARRFPWDPADRRIPYPETQ
jgi:methylglyoxal synthase